MKERPILFSGPMVRAILEGRKTQTRRIVKQVPHWEHCGKDIMEWGLSDCYTDENGTHWLDIQTDVDDNSHKEISCPHGKTGSRLWVREQFSTIDLPMENHITCSYKADDDQLICKVPQAQYDKYSGTNFTTKNRPSIHMPRWASRINLEITGVRVERLQDISDVDAKAEGIVDNGFAYLSDFESGKCYGTASEAYNDLWEKINGPGSWDANPLVWVIEFKRIL